MFSPSSRYHGIETATLQTPGGRTVTYVRRRFIPQPDRFAAVQVHTVAGGNRLDNITAQYFGDPEQFHLICDANNTMHPLELTEVVGRRLRITLPEGIPVHVDE
jgi:hypothetical protein